MACLPYDALNIFDIVENSSSTTNFSDYTVTTITGDNVTNVTNLQAAASGDSYGNVFSILKVISSHFWLKNYQSCRQNLAKKEEKPYIFMIVHKLVSKNQKGKPKILASLDIS